jgi:hypothetical protein
MSPIGKLNVPLVFVLRIGLGLVFLYAGINMLLYAYDWTIFIPAWVSEFVSDNLFLSVWGGLQCAIGLAIISGKLTKYGSIAALIVSGSVIVFHGVDTITFRDFGLFAAALALVLIINKNPEGR